MYTCIKHPQSYKCFMNHSNESNVYSPNAKQ